MVRSSPRKPSAALVLSVLFVTLTPLLAHAGVTTRVSVSSAGTQANGPSGGPEAFPRVALASGGRFVAFASAATNLVGGDTNGCWDVFVHDRQTGATTRVSVSSVATQGNADSRRPAITPDGRYVAFESEASSLVADDTNGSTDVFVYDCHTGQTTRASVDSAGNQGNNCSYAPTVTADGRYVAFESYATNLVPGDTNGYLDIFAHDLQTGQTSAVTQGNGWSDWAAISEEGRYVAFESAASNLVPGDTNGAIDVFRHDCQTGDTIRVSVDSGGNQGNGWSEYFASTSADGRHVAFYSAATNLVPGDTNGCSDAFVHDCLTGETARVSVDSAGNQGDADSRLPAISADGSCVAFRSNATNLVPGDTNGCPDVFAHDRPSGRTSRVSVDSAGNQGDQASHNPSVSADGRQVAFYSDATNLVPGDTNGVADVFVHSRPPRLEWAGASGYEADGVDPETGTPNATTFTFKVKYTDPTGSPPALARCIVQRKDCGSGWHGCATLTLTKGSGDIATGAIYSAATLLPNVTLKYRFRFKASDGTAVAGDPNVWLQGPLMTAVPHLCWTGNAGFEADGVEPNSGPPGTTFKFEVRYADSAGDAPTTHELVIQRKCKPWRTEEMTAAPAGNYRFGKVYRASVTIEEAGTYRFRFNFADASGKAIGPASGWNPGPPITGGAGLVTSVAATPTDAGAQVTFGLTDSASVTLTVLNVAGRPIRTVVAEQPMGKGLRTLVWDRKGETGLRVPPGMYLVRVVARSNDGAQSTGIAVLKVR